MGARGPVGHLSIAATLRRIQYLRQELARLEHVMAADREIMALARAGMAGAQIAKQIGRSGQHVYNVINKNRRQHE